VKLKKIPFLLAPAVLAAGLSAAEFKPRLSFGVKAEGLFLTNPAWLRAVKEADDILVRNQLGDFSYVIESNYGYTTFVPGAAVEAALQVTPALTLALGLGYYGQSWAFGGTFDSRPLPGPDLWGVKTAYAYKLRIIPVTFEARYLWLDKPGFRLEVTSSAGIYFAGMDYDKSEEHGFQSYWTGLYMNFLTVDSCRDGARSDLGFRLGLRGEIGQGAAVRMTFEAEIQVVPLGDIRGTLDSVFTQSENGKTIYSGVSSVPGSALTNGGTSLSGVLLRAGLSFGARR
jgi:hypothetical protein